MSADSADTAVPEIPGASQMKLLGRSAGGSVYRARQVAHARDVAVRVFDGERRNLMQMRQCAQDQLGIVHPNVVRVYAVDEHQGTHFLTMEHFAGGTLWSKVETEAERGLAWREAVRIVNFAAAGLSALHDKRWVHGAVRPSNVNLRKEGHVKLGDMGLVPFPGEPARLGPVAAAFTAPEVAAGEPATMASDIYSLGASLYYALTGRAPYEGDDTATVLAAIAAGEPDPLEMVKPGLPRELYGLVSVMTARDPVARPAGLAEVRRRLTALFGIPDAVKDAAAKSRGRAWVKPAIALGLVAVAGVVVWQVFGRGADDAAPPAPAPVAAKAPPPPPAPVSDAARKLSYIVAREKVLGPPSTANTAQLRDVAEQYRALAQEFSIDEPPVASAWDRRRTLLRALGAFAGGDAACAARVDRWMAELTDPANAPPTGALPDARGLEQSREQAVAAARQAFDEGRDVEGLDKMALWIVMDARPASRNASTEEQAAQIKKGVDWFRKHAGGFAARLAADGQVDAEILRTHLDETTAFGGRTPSAGAPDLVRAAKRMTILNSLLVTPAFRARGAQRAESIAAQAEMLTSLHVEAPEAAAAAGAPQKGDAPPAAPVLPWPQLVGAAIETQFDRMPEASRAAALRLVAETGDLARTRTLVSRKVTLSSPQGVRARAEAASILDLAALPPAAEPERRAEEFAKWIAGHVACDAGIVALRASGDAKALDAHPVVAPAEAVRFLESWGRTAAGGENK